MCSPRSVCGCSSAFHLASDTIEAWRFGTDLDHALLMDGLPLASRSDSLGDLNVLDGGAFVKQSTVMKRPRPSVGPTSSAGCAGDVAVSDPGCPGSVRGTAGNGRPENGDGCPLDRDCWDALKRTNGTLGSRSLRDLPGFVTGLVALHADGWGKSDIALMFGVTRERVRQWFRMCGLTTTIRGSRRRRWSWDARRFLPVNSEAERTRIAGR